MEIKIGLNKTLLIDKEDYFKIKGLTISCVVNFGISYASTKIDKKYKYIHRIIMGAKKGQIVDHVNGNGLDCRKVNLRFCSQYQNLANSGKRKSNKSGYKGVSWHPGMHKWRASISVNNKKFYIGFSNSPKEAAIMYNKKAKELLGDFAFQNKI